MNAKKLLSTLLSAAMAVSMLAGCFGGGGNKNYSDKAADAANAVQSTVVFATDAKLSKSLQDALENFTQLDDIKDAMEADENLKPLLTSGYDLDVVAEQGEDAEAAAKAIAEKYILSIVSGKKAEGKIAMVLHDGNGYYYVAVLTYGNGGSGSGGGAGGNRPGPGDDDDDEEENGHVFLKGITVTPPSTLVYVVGQEFQPEDMTITAFYSDGSSKDVTLDSKWECKLWNNKVFTTAGDSQVVVTYEGKKAAFSITVVPVTLTDIQVSGDYRTEYYEGQFFDNQKLVVEACYNNGDVKVVTDYKLSCDGFDGEDKLKPGKYNVVVEYEGFTAEIPISVTPIEWKRGEVTCSKTYTYGDIFEEDSLAVKVEYTDTSTETITKFDKIEFVPQDAINEDNRFTTAGEVKIQVTYTDKFGEAHEGSVTIKVNNKNPEIVGNLAVTTDKTFEVGDQIRSSDLTVTVAYKDALGKEWTETIKDFTITNPTGVFTKADDQYPVSVAYEDQYGNKATGSTTVTVVEKQHRVWVDVSDSSKFYNYADFDVIYAPFVTDGGSFTFKVQMRPDKADAWKVGGADVQGEASEVKVESLGDDKYQITVLNIKSDITITVKFESVTPKVDSITVAWKSGATIYVGDTIDNDNWSNYLTVTAFDADDNKIENPNITLSDSHTFKKATKYTGYVFTFEVNGASKFATVAFEVKMPTFTLDSNGQTFRQGSSLFYKDSGAESFRTGMRFKRTDKDSNLPITQPMVETIKNIIVLSYTAPNGTVYDIYPSSDFGFTSPGAWKAEVYYYDTSADIAYEITIDITVTT